MKQIERERTLHPCPSCDTHADAPLLSWRQGVHRTWCPTYGRTLLAMFLGLLALAVIGVFAPKRGRYFDWRLFAFTLNAVVVMLLFHLRARKARARLDRLDP
jgi:hypothetical protein